MTGYPQISFNPYSMYQNWGYGYQYPAFRGVQNQPQPVSVPQPNVNLQTPPDTVSFKATEHIQTKPKPEPLKLLPINFFAKVFGSPETFFQKRFLVSAGQRPARRRHKNI